MTGLSVWIGAMKRIGAGITYKHDDCMFESGLKEQLHDLHMLHLSRISQAGLPQISRDEDRPAKPTPMSPGQARAHWFAGFDYEVAELPPSYAEIDDSPDAYIKVRHDAADAPRHEGKLYKICSDTWNRINAFLHTMDIDRNSLERNS